MIVCVHYGWILLLSFLCGSCGYKTRSITKKIHISSYVKNTRTFDQYSILPPVNVWIHGTRFVPRPLKDDFFGGAPSFKKVGELGLDVYARKIASTLHAINSEQFPLETFYSFVWSGGISAADRLFAADRLYSDLTTLVEEYQKEYGVYPLIRLISHSHGGNVALNLVMIQHEKKPSQSLVIDQLILLACPVQEATMKLARDPMFKTIFSLYSSLDMIQVIAPQHFYGILPFSYRTFPKHSNIVQAKVRIDGHAALHTEFTTLKFFKSLPAVLDALESVSQTVDDEWKRQHVLLRINTRAKRKDIRCRKQHQLQQGVISGSVSSPSL